MCEMLVPCGVFHHQRFGSLVARAGGVVSVLRMSVINQIAVELERSGDKALEYCG